MNETRLQIIQLSNVNFQRFATLITTGQLIVRMRDTQCVGEVC